MVELTQDQIDDVMLDARAGELDELKAFFDEHKVQVLPQIKDEYSLSTALHMASANNHLEVAKYLVDLCKDDQDILKQIIDAKNESGNTPLHWACLNGHLEIVKVLCDAGAQPFITNEAKHDAFYEAEANDKEDVIDYLLQRFDIGPEDDEPQQQETEPKQDEELTEKVENLNVQ